MREYTKRIDIDLQVLNEKIGVLESGHISTNSKLAELEVSVGRVDKKRSHTKPKSTVRQAQTALDFKPRRASQFDL